MKIYLNKAFLTNFFLNHSADEELHFFVNRLLCNPQNGIELIIDFDFEDAYKDSSLRPLFRQIAQKLPLTDVTFINSCQTSAFHNDAQARLFLLDEQVELNLEERFGCVMANSTSLDKMEFLSNVEDLRIHKGMRDWNGLSKLQHPCNSLLITDNYLFSNDDNLDNVKSILKAIMAKSLDADFVFHLTIIGFDAKKSFQPIGGQKAKLEDFLKQYFTYKVDLTIIREDHHDRNIFTNYGRFSSGKGFGLFKKNRLSENDETTVTFHPITHKGRLSSTQSVRNEELEKCRKINRTERMPDRLILLC
jgi:hypothetical protein